MSEVLDEMIGEMVSGDALGVVKEALEQAQCESVMEDADGVSHALHSIEYLGPSVHAILTSSAPGARPLARASRPRPDLDEERRMRPKVLWTCRGYH